MRPVRLDIEGFTAFRDPVSIDFEGADLFALTGPTGSGKSSIIDALGFALYGCVPRLDRRMVAPVISLGSTEARVCFEFTVAGEPYAAVRVVRRTKTGASTREARLERMADGEVLAGNEKELTAEVERLLGLGFDQFTKCVVLPQGDFMRLLHDEPSKRQDLLVALLDLGLYERMARIANRRATLAGQAAEVSGRLLAKLAAATPQAKGAAEARVTGLAAVRNALSNARPRLEALHAAKEEAQTDSQAATDRARLVESVTVPPGLEDRGAEVAAARNELARCVAVESDAVRCVDEAVVALGALPTRSVLDLSIRAYADRDRLVDQHAGLLAAIEPARLAEADAADADAAAEIALAVATAAVQQARWAHRAADLAVTLVPGEPCPVCQQSVECPPDIGTSDERAAAAEADTALAAAAAVRRRTSAALRSAENDRLTAENRLIAVSDQIGALDARLRDAPPQVELEPAVAAVDRAEVALAGARATDRKARQATQVAQARLQAGMDAEAADRRRFAEARDKVAALEPPPAGSDLVADWADLVAWATATRRVEAATADAAAGRAATASAECDALAAEMATMCSEAGVEVRGGDLFEAVADQLAEARSVVKRIEAEMAESATHRSDLAAYTRSATVARDLARHLSASHFEKWVLDEALSSLVAGATEVLRELSGGNYSLGLDDRSNFLVIDHRNADEVRSARTLSGGETFLASLALALALADQIGQLAAHGAARLESIFLDEGFGTLDQDTLDTVAAAIEELGARGRTVGLISHVPELAERVPVRFEVVKGPSTSTVARIDA